MASYYFKLCTINKPGMVLNQLLKYFTDATSANTIECVMASRTFAVVQTAQGNEFSVG